MEDDQMSDRPMYYDRSGTPLELMAWAMLHKDMTYKIVVKTDVGPYTVSTVWLGADHQFFDGGPPLIFESMVFEPERPVPSEWRTFAPRRTYRPEFDHFTTRYSTEDEAKRGHELIVEALRQAVALFDDAKEDQRGES
jgi:hypothetical protein